MNLAFTTGPLAQAIGWALLHLLWQGALVAGLLAAALALLSGRSANLRYALSCAALVLIVGLGVVTAVRSYAPDPVAARVALALVARTPIAPAPPSAPDLAQQFARAANRALPALVTLWILGVALFSLRLLREWLGARRLVARSAPAADAMQDAARRLGAALGVQRLVRLLESTAVTVPSVIGFVRPAILLPASTVTGLTPAQLEMILAHELAHIRRHDFLVNLLQAVVETLLFYHPAVWWISRQVRIERENCCDDIAVALCGDPVHYARTLARLEELRPHRLPLAVSAAGGSLFHRVRRLVDRSARPSGPAVRGASALAVLSCLVLAVAAQSFAGIGARRPAVEEPYARISANASASFEEAMEPAPDVEPTADAPSGTRAHDGVLAAEAKSSPKPAAKPAPKPAAKPDAPDRKSVV